MTNTQCPKCGFMDAVASEFCHKCGAELSARVSLENSSAFNRSTDDRNRTDRFSAKSMGFQPFDGVGAVLTPTINLFFKNFVLITKIVFVVFAPYEILKATTLIPGRESLESGIFVILMLLVCKALVAPAMIYSLVVKIDTGRTPGLNEAYRWSLSRIGPLILCAVCAWIAVALGYILLIIPGIILSMAFVVVYPMVTLEGGGPIDVLKRSYELTYGYKAKIFWATFVIGLLYSVATVPLGIASVLEQITGNSWPVNALVTLIGDIFTESYSVFGLVVYLSLARNSYQRVNLAVPSPEAL